ncbi:hypothetical protein GZ77_25965 [Endozoicomonas montiporae]|uniref:Secreted protein n=1 Tax=Endozoicomonas montiporae TaxID=1027273 RepID=A0A081MYQ9_9GAMM|nr:hypothetical protein [Endozoicomonas montiporae]KEQ11332.1 hypothetical protein GZ77_25965 [Endozoicomonas montiporae]
MKKTIRLYLFVSLTTLISSTFHQACKAEALEQLVTQGTEEEDSSSTESDSSEPESNYQNSGDPFLARLEGRIEQLALQLDALLLRYSDRSEKGLSLPAAEAHTHAVLCHLLG